MIPSCAGWNIFARITKETNAQARQMFEKAVALDPQYAEAYRVFGLDLLTGDGACAGVETPRRWSAR